MVDEGREQFLTALQMHALRLLGAWFAWARDAEWIGKAGRDGLAIDPDELSRLLERIEPTAPSVPNDAPVDAEGCYETFRADIDAQRAAGASIAARWCDVVARLGLAPVEEQLLAVLIAIGADHGLCRAYRYAWADFGRVSMPLGFAARLLGGSAEPTEGGLTRSRALLSDRTKLFTHQLVKLHRESVDTPLSEAGLVADDETVSVLIGANGPPRSFLPLEAIGAPPGRLGETLLRALDRARSAAAGLPNRWTLYGPFGSGGLESAGWLVPRTHPCAGLWRCDLGRAVEGGSGIGALRAALRGAVLWDAALVIQGVDRLPEDLRRRWTEAAEELLEPTSLHVFWLLDELLPTLDVVPEAIVPLGYPSRDERHAVWQGCLDGALSEMDTERLGGRFLITEGQIERTVAEARARAQLETGGATGEALLDEIEVVARREAAVGLGRLATPESKRVGLEMLVVDEETHTLLHEIISYTRYRERLAEDWGFERMMPYGLGVTALFTGPPGTGKTLAANAIATALGLELYRVDLSQLVSKYIGETEKHLSTLFNAAESGEVMLLFDEADSLFSKRTEVKSSVDRYANLEVNYLLQRIERYNGVVILTTNFEAGIDDAFARRIRFRVGFPEPDANARVRLWRALTPPDVPLADDVDFHILAEDYELTGGHIKEVVLRASALAMGGEYGSEVTQDLLIRSAEAEYRKLGKLVMIYDDQA